MGTNDRIGIASLTIFFLLFIRPLVFLGKNFCMGDTPWARGSFDFHCLGYMRPIIWDGVSISILSFVIYSSDLSGLSSVGFEALYTPCILRGVFFGMGQKAM